VKGCPGEREFEACTVQPIEAPKAPPGTTFKTWTGDTAWLKDTSSPKTTLTMPFKNVRLEAVFAKGE
jgi:hypothetical protein